MDDQHFIGKVRQKAIIVKGNQVLITREENDLWELPGGRLHLNEVPEEGLQREIREELGAEVQIGAIIYIEQYIKTRIKEPNLLLAYVATLQDESKPLIFQDKEIAEAKWITKDQLFDQKMYENCLNALKKYFGIPLI
jgi:ADP-ribose pyrophosphatase YjhB (NUDIX family)